MTRLAKSGDVHALLDPLVSAAHHDDRLILEELRRRRWRSRPRPGRSAPFPRNAQDPRALVPVARITAFASYSLRRVLMRLTGPVSSTALTASPANFTPKCLAWAAISRQPGTADRLRTGIIHDLRVVQARPPTLDFSSSRVFSRARPL